MPIPWSMERVSAPVTDQFKVVLSPAVMLGGLAVKEWMMRGVGRGDSTTGR